MQAPKVEEVEERTMQEQLVQQGKDHHDPKF